jgi:Ser/Thr protein kinase RdoA (MazF antagonist)
MPCLGRLLFVWVQGAPYGDRRPTQAEYDEVGRLLDQLDQVAAGRLPFQG